MTLLFMGIFESICKLFSDSLLVTQYVNCDCRQIMSHIRIFKARKRRTKEHFLNYELHLCENFQQFITTLNERMSEWQIQYFGGEARFGILNRRTFFGEVSFLFNRRSGKSWSFFPSESSQNCSLQLIMSQIKISKEWYDSTSRLKLER